MPQSDVAVWHNDGHRIQLRLEAQSVYISEVVCPEGEDRACKHEDAECVVKYFLNRFGFECNVGSCDLTGPVELAWNLAGDARNLDECQVWVIPATDDAFSAWVASYNA